MSSSDPREKSFEFALETTKQLITLSTAIVALTITFVKDLAAAAPDWSLYLLALGWLAYLISIIAGVVMLMNLTGAMRTTAATVDDITGPIAAQFIAFVVGTIFVIAFGVAAVFEMT